MNPLFKKFDDVLEAEFNRQYGEIKFCAGIPRIRATEAARNEVEELAKRREAVDADKVQK